MTQGDRESEERDERAGWTFLSNHAHVLIAIQRNPDIRLREVAEQVGITERAAQRLVRELEDAGYLWHERVGRRNRYHIDPSLPLRHPLEWHLAVGSLLDLVNN